MVMNDEIQALKNSLLKQVELLEQAIAMSMNVGEIAQAITATSKALTEVSLLEHQDLHK